MHITIINVASITTIHLLILKSVLFSPYLLVQFEHGLTVDVRDNIMRWVHDANPMKKLEYDILHTYSIGLLAICLDW